MDPGVAGQRAGGSTAARSGRYGGAIAPAATAGSRAATARSAGATERSRSVRHPRSRRARSPDSPRRTACSSVRLSRPRRELHSIHPPSPRSAPLRSGTFSVLESGTFSLPIDTRPGRRALAGGRGAGRGKRIRLSREPLAGFRLAPGTPRRPRSPPATAARTPPDPSSLPRSAPLRSGTSSLPENGTFSLPIDRLPIDTHTRMRPELHPALSSDSRSPISPSPGWTLRRAVTAPFSPPPASRPENPDARKRRFFRNRRGRSRALPVVPCRAAGGARRGPLGASGPAPLPTGLRCGLRGPGRGQVAHPLLDCRAAEASPPAPPAAPPAA